ncbi:hypothetical protein NEOLEDRAFT_1077949, partial [Neolentinus lepideus HHB14362 ss-1]
FEEVNTAGEALNKLRTMKQAGKTADEFISEFKIHAAHSGITQDAALIDYFQEGLTTGLVSKIYNAETMPTTIQGWYAAAVKHDLNYRRLQAHRQRMQGKQPTKAAPKYVRRERDPDAMDVDHLNEEDRKKYLSEGKCF